MPNFFTTQTAKTLWKGIVSVSNAGRKRGRGRGAYRLVKDFNSGQTIGVGRNKLILPGMNTTLMKSKIDDLGDNPEFKQKLEEARQYQYSKKRLPLKPIERGWSGWKSHGKRAGQPDDYNDHIFEGFDSRVLMLRNLFSMNGILGRTKTVHSLVCTGNGNGLAGFSVALGSDPKSVVRHARNRAAQNLVKVPLFENHTVMHDFFSKYYDTTVFVHKKPKGYGLRAHRIIRSICEMFGIKDIHALVKGATNNQINLTKAFFLGLINQRRYEDMANEKGLHLVELREEESFYPNVLASPSGVVRTDEEIKANNENIDFTYFIYNGKIRTVKRCKPYLFESDPRYFRHLDVVDYTKNREKTKLMMAARYGDKKVKDVFPHFISNANSFNKPRVVARD